MTEQPDTADVEPDENWSWDEFWEQHKRTRRRTQTIRGVEVEVPTDLPLRFDHEIEDLADSEDDDDVQYLVAEVFGADVLDQWIKAGMGGVEFKAVLAWGMAAGKGKPITFAEAVGVAEQEKVPERLAGNRADRRASTKRSKSTGSRSSRTSAANTASRRKR